MEKLDDTRHRWAQCCSGKILRLGEQKQKMKESDVTEVVLEEDRSQGDGENDVNRQK